MGQIGFTFTTAGFSAGAWPAPPPVGHVSVSMPQLIRAATTVGATPVALGAPPRPLIELCWRACMVAANLEEYPSGSWVRTDAYRRLDASEKSAVSYFLGMIQAKTTTCEDLLGVTHLVHLDAASAALGLPASRRKRPDLLGFDLATMGYTLAVEAKGRSGALDPKAVERAKTQAQSLPSLIGTASTLRVAPLAYFETGAWTSYLEDPEPPVGEFSDRITVDLLLVAYYRPLVAVLQTDGIRLRNDTAGEGVLIGELPGMDLALGLPRGIEDRLALLPFPWVGRVAHMFGCERLPLQTRGGR